MGIHFELLVITCLPLAYHYYLRSKLPELPVLPISGLIFAQKKTLLRRKTKERIGSNWWS